MQISDLHFGDIDPTASSPDAVVRRFWRFHSAFDGLFGHHYVALEHLKRFFLVDLQHEDPGLIVTGDLTTVGSAEQFRTANDFLGRMLEAPQGCFLGLQVVGWQQRGIPGNHDHWPGRGSIWGRPTPALADCFPVLPYQAPSLFLGDSGLQLKFLGIDTDADVSPLGRKRFWARGDFLTQLQAAANDLPLEKPANEIRVLLLHHSHEYRGRALAMEDASRDALDEFLVAYEIPVILTGHVHVPHVAPFTAVHPTQHLARTVLEARCGTTTQRDSIPLTWKTPTGQRPKERGLTLNTLLVHRLLWDGTELTWQTETYRRTPRGFVRPDRTNPVPRAWSTQAALRVWPWP